MKLLVFAHPPPPVHGQSVMVKTLLDGLRGHAGIEILHVDARLSRDHADIGRWRLAKLFSLIGACLRAWRLRLRHGPAYFYYVPAPGKRSALYRDFIVMILCRPWFSGLVLHWHAVGLGAWLESNATAVERWLAHRLLGDAALAIVLAPALANDARLLTPRRVAIVPNCIPDPGLDALLLPPHGAGVSRVLFLGSCSRAKGVFYTLEAYDLLTRRTPGRYFLTIAGGFESPEEEREFHARLAALPPGTAQFVGFADAAAKRALFAQADVFCFPTFYPHEGQPLTVIEGLAHDVPIVTTRWRAIPEMLPATNVWYVEPSQPAALADALAAAATARPGGALRQHYLDHFTPDRHLATLASALLSLATKQTLSARDGRGTSG